MRNLAFAAAALATLTAAISPASAQVRRPATVNAYAAAQAQQQQANPLPNHGNVTRDPDAFIRDYDRNNPPGTQWD
jgi:hypothetical protein